MVQANRSRRSGQVDSLQLGWSELLRSCPEGNAFPIPCGFFSGVPSTRSRLAPSRCACPRTARGGRNGREATENGGTSPFGGGRRTAKTGGNRNEGGGLSEGGSGEESPEPGRDELPAPLCSEVQGICGSFGEGNDGNAGMGGPFVSDRGEAVLSASAMPRDASCSASSCADELAPSCDASVAAGKKSACAFAPPSTIARVSEKEANINRR
jgi:hypothetical protein